MPDRLQAGRFIDAGRTLFLIGLSRAEGAGRVLRRMPSAIGAQVEARLPEEITTLGNAFVGHASRVAHHLVGRIDTAVRSRTPDDSH